ncbi:MAG: HAD family hydrolase [Ignavibacteriales bacterium]|nr:HAD family hydrolase [Ignavibacteriales bacterium]
MQSLYKGVLFDIDGTLTSTNQLIFDTFNHILKKYKGKTFSNQEIIALFGPPEEDILSDLFGDKLEEVQADYYSYYENNHGQMVDLYPGIQELLEDLHDAGAVIGAFTGKGRRCAIITMEQTEIIKYFKIVISGSDVVNHKPHHEGIMTFMEQFNLAPSETVMIGDATADILAARGAGVDALSVVWDSYGIEDVTRMNPNNVYKTVAELRKVLLKSSPKRSFV